MFLFSNLEIWESTLVQQQINLLKKHFINTVGGFYTMRVRESAKRKPCVCYCYFVVLCCYLFLMITYTYKDTCIVLVVCVIAFSDIKNSISVTVSDSFLTVISVGAFKTFFLGLFSKFTFNKWPISCKHRKHRK